jgi:hypothetical protein
MGSATGPQHFRQFKIPQECALNTLNKPHGGSLQFHSWEANLNVYHSEDLKCFLSFSKCLH